VKGQASQDTGSGARWAAAFHPPTASAGAWGTWVLDVTVGQGGITTGGGLRCQLPDSWHAYMRNGAKGMQSEDEVSPNYVSAETPRPDVELSCTVEGGTTESVVKSNRVGLDGREGRYVYVTRVRVESGVLREGDAVRILYGDQRWGSPGFVAALHPEGPEEVVLHVDTGVGEHVPLVLGDPPTLEVVAGPPEELQVIAPSIVAVGEPNVLRVAVLDRHANLVRDARGTLHVTPDGVVSDMATTVELATEDLGRLHVPFTLTTEGVVRFSVTLDGVELGATSNPVKVVQDPGTKLYWGDLHSHAYRSFDAVGSRPHDYARDGAALDFFALTEHCERWPSGSWEDIVGQAREHEQLGRFVVFPAYEATFGEPWGHHNVYFEDADHAVASVVDEVVGAHNGTLLELWAALQDSGALTIPHHTGVAFGASTRGNIPGSSTPNPDWRHHDADLRRLIEIYSGHGQSESYDPAHPLSYDRSLFSTNSSRAGPYYAQDAWLQGHVLGVIASSDNHRAQPGRPELGLAAVWANELSAKAVFGQLRARRTFGAVGGRILLEFTLDDRPMGSVLSATTGDIEVEVHGTGVIDLIEVVAADLGAGGWKLAHRWEPGVQDFADRWHDPSPLDRGLYYVRMRQRGQYRGRIPMAWSSPIWVLPDGKP
jgi:hypothetical protein